MSGFIKAQRASRIMRDLTDRQIAAMIDTFQTRPDAIGPTLGLAFAGQPPREKLKLLVATHRSAGYDPEQFLEYLIEATRQSGRWPTPTDAAPSQSFTSGSEARSRVTVNTTETDNAAPTLRPATVIRMRRATELYGISRLMEEVKGLLGLGVVESLDEATRSVLNSIIDGFTQDFPAPLKQDCGQVILSSYVMGRVLLDTADRPIRPNGPEGDLERAHTMMTRAAQPEAAEYVTEFGEPARVFVDISIAAAGKREATSSLPAERRDKLVAVCATSGLMVAIIEHDLYGPGV